METVPDVETGAPLPADPDGLMRTLDLRRLLALQRLAGNQAVVSLRPDRAAASAERVAVQRDGTADAVAAESARVARLVTEYNTAVAAPDWNRAAVLLNAFSPPDQQTRLAALNLDQLTALQGAAQRLGWPSLIAVIQARRVAQLSADYDAAVAAGRWLRAAELLNAFSDPDIQTRVRALTAPQRVQLMAAARQSTTIGDGSRIINPLRALTGRQSGRIFGTVTTSQVLHHAASAGADYSFEFRIVFTPDPTVVDSTQIAFVQTSRLVDTAGANAEYMEPQNSRRNALNEAIDRINGRKYGWYGFNNDLTTAGTITPGVSPGPPVVPARFFDEPRDALVNVSFNFETSIIARQGTQANLVYSVVHWGFDVNASGHLTAHAVTIEDRPTAGFATAVAAWNTQAAGPAAGRNAPDQQALPNFR